MTPFLLLFLFFAHRCYCQLEQCYAFDGTTRPDFPCDPSVNVSACCGHNFTCSTNFYCSGDGFRGVGSCTDKTWQDPACPLALVAGRQFNFTQNTTACDDGTFCPQPQNTTCCFKHQGSSQTVYHYDAPLPSVAADLGEFYARNGYQIATFGSSSSDGSSTVAFFVSVSVLPTKTTAPLSISAIASSAKSTQSPPTSATASPTNITVPPSTSAAASPTIPTALLSTSAAGPSTINNVATGFNSSTKVGVGVGVGVTVGASLVGVLLYLLARRLRRRLRRRPDARWPPWRGAEVVPPESRRYEMAELTGEESRKEMDAAERGKAELAGDEAGTEMDTPRR